MRLNPLIKLGCVFEGHHWFAVKRLPLGATLYRCRECGAVREKWGSP